MKADRVVADTNVLISAALLPDGRPRAVVDAVRLANGVLLFSDETLMRHSSSFGAGSIAGSSIGMSGVMPGRLGWPSSKRSRNGF